MVVNSVWFWGAQPVESEFTPFAFHYRRNGLILHALSRPAGTGTIQIEDYRALFGAELAMAVEQLPSAAKLWLNNGRVFQECTRGKFLQRLWHAITTKVHGIQY